ncbi:protein kinase [Myxococcus sp. K15C18031901]|uniref:serine/threonine protein kinase n=1 Tax=Myxococcus dinghuensis TaxID=2906761 RepID=UPI0020A80E9B|nr:serine/threonine-protein kinase [Myxococcus dinghuensis]MCP3105543.1 protein kinase [Myxococcus dinghuensis]
MLTLLHPPAQFPPGHVIHGWRIVKLVGAGAYGAVYKVEMNGKHYAMKVALHRATSGDAEKSDARLKRELGCLVHLEHPNIIALRALGRWPDFETGWRYVILDFVEGFTLAQWVEQVHPTAQEVARLFVKLAGAVDHMHGRGVFHRDLKLNNIMVRASDNEPFIIDFSAGDYSHAEDLTDAPLPPGTRRYRSPEATRFFRDNEDDRDARYEFKVTDDVYALGVCLFDVLTAPQPASDFPRTPVEGRAMPPDARVLNERVPGPLSDAVMRFIARKPENRPPSAEAVRRELAAIVNESGEEWVTPLHTLAPKPLLTPATGTDGPRPARSRRGLLVGALGAALAVAALVGLFMSTSAEKAPGVADSIESTAPQTPGAGAPLNALSPQEDAGMSQGDAVASPPLESSSPGVASPPQSPVQKESPAVKRAPIVASPSESPAVKAPASSGGRAEFLKKCAVATAAVALQMGCPSSSQVRPGSSECPEEARQAMAELRFWEGDAMVVTIDASQPGAMGGEGGIYSSGPVRGIVRKGVERIPAGTMLRGRVWVGERSILARYTEATLPNGRTYPVCIAIGEKGPEEADPGPRPGTVEFNRSMYGYAVKEWP